VHADTRWSALGFAVVVPVFATWTLTFLIGGERVFSSSTYNKLDITRINLKYYGWVV